MGKASVTHQVIIKAAIANALFAFASTEKGLRKKTQREIKMAAAREIHFFVKQSFILG